LNKVRTYKTPSGYWARTGEGNKSGGDKDDSNGEEEEDDDEVVGGDSLLVNAERYDCSCFWSTSCSCNYRRKQYYHV
jgi:hypothetical protein